MKIYVLWYDYYEDSGIVGIYTEEGKRKKIEELQQKSLEYCKKWGEEFEKILARTKEERAVHLKKVNQAIEACKNSPENKSFRQLKRSLIKEDESLLKKIHLLQKKVDEHFLPETTLKIYMQDEHLTWLEREVIE